MRATNDDFRITFTLVDIVHPQSCYTVCSGNAIAAVEQSVEEDPNGCVRHHTQKLGRHYILKKVAIWCALWAEEIQK